MAQTAVSAAELRAHIDDSAWVVFDCRHALADFELGRALYGEAHIPGAYFADVERDLAGAKTGTNGRHPMPESSDFADFLATCGVRDETQIVAYDAGGDMFAARLWFLSRWIGHDRVAILDGGIQAWLAENLPTTAQLPEPRARGRLSVHVHPEYIVDAQYVQSHLHAPNVTVLDARATDRFAGMNETVDPVAGHIPGARNRPFKSNFEADGRLKSPDTLRAEFDALDLPSATIIHQCGSGVSASANALAMAHAGLSGSRIYAGSWSEWIADPSRPVATGDEVS